MYWRSASPSLCHLCFGSRPSEIFFQWLRARLSIHAPHTLNSPLAALLSMPETHLFKNSSKALPFASLCMHLTMRCHITFTCTPSADPWNQGMRTVLEIKAALELPEFFARGTWSRTSVPPPSSATPGWPKLCSASESAYSFHSKRKLSPISFLWTEEQGQSPRQPKGSPEGRNSSVQNAWDRQAGRRAPISQAALAGSWLEGLLSLTQLGEQMSLAPVHPWEAKCIRQKLIAVSRISG